MAGLDDLVRNVADKYGEIGFEGIILLDGNGDKVYEKRWVQDYPRDIYSNTKSFTAAAVGMAIYQHKLSLDTKVSELFKIENENELWMQMRLEDLLTMRSGFEKEHLMYFDRRKGIGADDYLAYMLSQKVSFAPGSNYIYSTGDAVLAGCMVEKAVGMNLHSYLYKYLFIPLGIDYPIWESDMCGHSCGGSGLQLKLADMAMLGIIYLNGGFYKGIRFFDQEWAKKSFESYVALESKNYPENYGYFWRICNNGQFYKATGVFGQDTLVFPKECSVLAYQCREGTDTSMLRDILQKEIFDKLS